MSEINSNSGLPNKQSRTDWNWLAQAGDDEIDYSDIPPLNEGFFRQARSRSPCEKVAITINVDADVLAWFNSQQDDCEQRINAALRIYAEAHRP
ncbi:MAG: BrnA antitoxin family protein [Acidobacteriota bacterium]|nr:BrnA antitoxin family protein [Acidobacteriota bacterium]